MISFVSTRLGVLLTEHCEFRSGAPIGSVQFAERCPAVAASRAVLLESAVESDAECDGEDNSDIDFPSFVVATLVLLS
eukprot:SAG31_NODE_757_length_12296_cov_8.840289_2_plen_78_part_00